MRFKFLVPLLVFVAVAMALFVGLFLKPAEVPSVLVGKSVPEFSLPPFEGAQKGLSSADLKTGQVSIVNVFASWCVPCRVEHPQLMALEKTGVPIYAIAYKDRAEAVRNFLTPLGNPFRSIGDDRSGRVGIDWGVYGVPETFIVAGDGRIVYRHVGPIMEQDIADKIMPAIEKAKTS
ncbi:DsbE family thiol:disulfide interchange protein [Govanella unica]|uniref:DsbE family thiol:disulfide interchange protein n=1 Tax=Govanella unica TaxID=2975056 RepID=A0A9X3TW96_9PROT|nr:DsbE family thiol:disulfide interchange protein [Govania unica]MDA5192714.1 DsbE family thiol:disulfide interchange protein [Govania unica]